MGVRMFNETLKWSVFVIVVIVIVSVSCGDGCGAVKTAPDSEGQGGEIGSKRGEEDTGGDGRGWGISGGRRQKVGRKAG